MRLTLLFVAALVAAGAADAREAKKKTEEAPPPPPAVAYELEDAQMSDALPEACIAIPAEQETYDSRDNVVITRIEGGGRGFFHLKGACDTNTIIFAEKIAREDGAPCVKPGDTLVFSSSYGDQKKCVVESINRWLDDEPLADDESFTYDE